MRRVLQMLITMCLMVVSYGRAAAETEVSVNLEGDGATPSHVCVVTLGAQTTEGIGLLPWSQVEKKLLQEGQDLIKTFPEPGGLLIDEKVIANAMAPLAAEDSCPSRRRVKLTTGLKKREQELKIMCRAASQPRADSNPHTLILWLDPFYKSNDTSVLVLEDFDVNGRSVVLRLRGNKSKTMMIGVAGGDYPPSEHRVTTGRPVTLALLPRCAIHELALLPNVYGDLQVKLSTQTDPLQLTSGNRVQIPYTSEHGERTLEIADKEGKHFKARASWSGPVPPTVIPTRTEQLSFRWVPTCLYPSRTKCPQVLPMPNLQCSASPETSGEAELQECVYTCTAPQGGRSLDLPAALTFKIDLGDAPDSGVPSITWTDTLQRAGETLRGFVPPEDRTLAVRVPEYHNWQGYEIERLDLRNPGGKVYSLQPKSNKGRTYRLRVPHIQCGTAISYRWVGTRSYKPTVVQVKSGGFIDVAAPHNRLDDIAGFGFRIGAMGASPTLGGNSWHPYATVDGLFVWHVLPYKLGHIAFHPDIEIHVGASIGQRQFATAVADEDADDDALLGLRNVWQLRVPFIGGLSQHFYDKFYAGFGAGAELMLPLLVRDRPRLPTQLKPVIALHIGYWASASIAAEAVMQLTLDEHVYRFDFGQKDGALGQFRGSPLRIEESTTTFMSGVRFRVLN